jgi:hypothetical protein
VGLVDHYRLERACWGLPRAGVGLSNHLFFCSTTLPLSVSG